MSGEDQASARPGMQDSGAWYPAFDDSVEAFAVHAMRLAPPSKCVKPISFGFALECFQGRHISRDRVVVEVALHNAPQPCSRVWNRVMPVTHQFESNCLQLCAQPLRDRSSFHCEASTPVRSPTAMREAQEVEALGFAFPSSASVLLGLSVKLDQPRPPGACRPCVTRSWTKPLALRRGFWSTVSGVLPTGRMA